MKIAIFAASCLALAAAPAAAQIPPLSTPLGVWWMPEHSSKIRIAPCPNAADKLCGTLVWIKPRDPSKPVKTRDGKPPPDPQSFIGRMILVDLKPDGPGKWSGGRFQFPGLTRKISANLAVESSNELKLKGCVALVACGGMEMKRAE